MSQDKKPDILISYIKQNFWTFVILFLIMMAIGMVKVYQHQHPLVCSSTGQIKEIISINQNFAKMKLQNDEIINYPISTKKEVTTPSGIGDPTMNFLYYETKTIVQYNANVKIGDTVCLEYSRK